jgi:hypothetical protein
MAKQHSVTVALNRTMKLISTNMRYFRERVALDTSFQSESRWEEKQATAYMTSLITGMAPSKIVVANIKECMDKCMVESKDYEYYNDWLQKGFEWISIDGNNRTITIDQYLNGSVKLKHGQYPLPNGVVDINDKNDTYKKHPKILLDFIESSVEITVAEYVSATRNDLSNIFINVNDGVSLNAQELRNARLVPFAGWVRDTVKKHKNEFRKVFTTEKQEKRRLIDDFVVGLAIYSSFGAEHGVAKSDKDNAYEDDSVVSKQTKNASSSIDSMCKIVKKHATTGFKDHSTMLNFYMVIDYLRKNNFGIINDAKLFQWFMRTENRRLGSKKILVESPKSGELRTYASCCNTMSKLELTARYKAIMEDFEIIESGIVAQRDSERLFTPQQRYEAWVRQFGVCPITGEHIPEEEINDHEKWAADHIVPHTFGGPSKGTDGTNNCQLVAKSANLKKGSKMTLGEVLV